MKESKPKKPLVSVVIPSYNSGRYIEQCLRSIFEQHTTFSYEVIVVDSSIDNTANIITQHFPQVQLLRQSQKTLPGAGRNIGVAAAKGNLLAFLDSDCIAASNWLETAVGSIRDAHLLVGGSVLNANPQTFLSKADHMLTFNESLAHLLSQKVRFWPSCNFVCTREAFEKIGGFDSSILIGEDSLFCRQALHHYHLWFEPSMQVAHHNRDTWKTFWRHHYQFGFGSAQLRQKMDLPGSFLARHSLLSFLAAPIRAVRLSARLLTNRKIFMSFISVSPFIGIGLVAWGCGFVGGSFRK